MPEISPAFSLIGRGFAAYLAPPSPDVVRFTVGQPDFDTPETVVQSAIDALQRGETAYTRSQGSVSLCEAVSRHLDTLGIDSNPDDVVITPGCKQALLYALMTTVTPGDEVLLLAPAWPSYDGMIRIFGGIPVHVPVSRPSYHPDFEALEASVTERTKAIMLNSPNNPTGAVYTPEEIEKIAVFAEKHDLWIVDDMIYSTLVWTDHDYTSPINSSGGENRTITIGGWSKG
ncbi:MAG: aminotransferase class I/II-fold pyridoxal phosphate-dependent enzyme, partial [Candidatus Thermoplasmatota archaeon]|nr:aminotransferase class I/II-fold pyridoxal phosphate-dependent enzyme [Candidatus Thermoplasmatota archaeon]